MIASPCVKVCVMDAEQRYCTGCLRTLGEIALWGEMNDVERAAVVAQLPARGLVERTPALKIAEVSVPPLA